MNADFCQPTIHDKWGNGSSATRIRANLPQETRYPRQTRNAKPEFYW